MNRTVAQNLAVCGAGLMLVALVGAGLPAVGAVPDDEARRVFGGQSGGGSGGSGRDLTKCRLWALKSDAGCIDEKNGKCTKVKSYVDKGEDSDGTKVLTAGFCYVDDTCASCGGYVSEVILCKKESSTSSGGSSP